MNKVMLVGKLAAEPEIKTSKAGKQYALVMVNVNRPAWMNGGCDAISGTVFGKAAEKLGELKSGDLVCCEGRVSVESKESQSGGSYAITKLSFEAVEKLDGLPF